MSGLLAENVELRKQNLQLMIQSALLVQQFQNNVTKTNSSIHTLTKKIPNQATVKGWVREENDNERKKVQQLRDEAIVALRQIKEVANANT